MKTKHTPGPWTHEQNERTGEWCIARTSAGKDIWASEANARLIAAAPDMLALLKDIENALLPFDYEGGDQLLDLIQATIAKATGGEK